MIALSLQWKKKLILLWLSLMFSSIIMMFSSIIIDNNEKRFSVCQEMLPLFRAVIILILLILSLQFMPKRRLLTSLLIFSVSLPFLKILGLIRTLFDRAYKIDNTLLSFNEEIKKKFHLLRKNQFPEDVISKVLNSPLLFLWILSHPMVFVPSIFSYHTPCRMYLTLSYFTKCKLHTLVKRNCKSLEINVAFSSFNIKNLMNVKVFIIKSLRSIAIYKFNCAGCNPCM